MIAIIGTAFVATVGGLAVGFIYGYFKGHDDGVHEEQDNQRRREMNRNLRYPAF